MTILDFESLSLVCDFENSYLGEAASVIGKQMSAREQAAQGEAFRRQPSNSTIDRSCKIISTTPARR